MRVLACVGDARSIKTWSGTPFFFLEAGQRSGFLDAGLALDPTPLRAHRLAWNAWRMVRHREIGGFQYSPFFLRRLLAQAEEIDATTEIISHFPLLPPQSAALPTSYYIDATLTQNFEEHRYKVGRRLAADALVRERHNYASAERVICMSRWTARSLIERYGLASNKVHVIPGGANLPNEDHFVSQAAPLDAQRPIRLGFVGRNWRSKRLTFLLEVADILHSRGYQVEVAAAGFAPDSGPTHPLMQAVGLIDKATSMPRFSEFIRSCHFGCLFSFIDAAPRSNLEFLRLGIPVLTHDVGGMRDTVPDGCGYVFTPFPDPDDVAHVIRSYVQEPERYTALRARIASRSQEFTWQSALKKLIAIWDGSDAYSYAHLAATF
jgi:glycosyltransferase involved in cell wall biosynthesis